MPAIDISQVKEHMQVVAADGEPIGKVDHLQDGKIKLTKNDSPDGQHHFVPLAWVQTIGADIRLNKSLAEIKAGATAPHQTDAVPPAREQDAVPKV